MAQGVRRGRRKCGSKGMRKERKERRKEGMEWMEERQEEGMNEWRGRRRGTTRSKAGRSEERKYIQSGGKLWNMREGKEGLKVK